MARIESPSTRQRGLTLALIAGLHAAVLVAVLSIPAPPIPRSPMLAGSPLTVIATALLDRAATPPPSLPSPTADHDLVHPLSPPSLATVATASAAGVAGCDAAAVIADAIHHDPAAMESLIAAPADTHTPAGAIAVWNGDWNPSTIGALAPLRTEILTAMETIDPVCLDEDVRGPRFIQITAGEAHYMLVFRSDVWRWNSLQMPTPDAAAPFASGGLSLWPPF